MIILDSYRSNVKDEPGWVASAGLEGVRNCLRGGGVGGYNGLLRAMKENIVN